RGGARAAARAEPGSGVARAGQELQGCVVQRPRRSAGRQRRAVVVRGRPDRGQDHRRVPAQRAPCGPVHRRGGAGRRASGTPAAPPMMPAAAEVFEGQQLAPSLKILLALTLLAVLPATILTTTSFVRT